MDITRDGVADVIPYRVVFTFKDGLEKEYDIRLDKKTLRLIQPEEKPPSPWASLKEFNGISRKAGVRPSLLIKNAS